MKRCNYSTGVIIKADASHLVMEAVAVNALDDDFALSERAGAFPMDWDRIMQAYYLIVRTLTHHTGLLILDL
jgi:aspartate aminotransferase-like enzyme